MRRIGTALWRIAAALLHPSARGAVAGLMLIMAGGRFGLWQSRPGTTWLTADIYGWLLALMGVALFTSLPWRLHWAGRLIAVLGAALLGGMAFDVGVWGNTALILAWFAVLLLRESGTSHEY